MTKVVHCKQRPYDIYIGRPSKWGCPFVIGKDGKRYEVIDKYREWIFSDENKELRSQIETELKDKVLGCWCRPAECHGDVLAAIADGRDKGD